MSLFRRGGGKADWLVVGLGNPGDRYARTRHNVGFEVAKLAAERWGMPKFKQKYGGLFTQDGRRAVLLPQTWMNESGSSAGPARGALGVDLDHVVAVHDEIDLPFGKVEVRTGGGLAGHNGLKSLKQGLGSGGFHEGPGRRRPPRQHRPRGRLALRARTVLGGSRRCAGVDGKRRRRAGTARKLELEPRGPPGGRSACSDHSSHTPRTTIQS